VLSLCYDFVAENEKNLFQIEEEQKMATVGDIKGMLELSAH
jgi:hypothetical protein